MTDSPRRPTALITGASSGIGYELARVFGAHGHDLVLTARREERLQALADKLAPSCRVTVLPLDLAKAKGPAKLLRELADAELSVDVLVNNAGVADTGPFQQLSGQKMRDLLNLNIRALTELTHGLLPAMLERGRGRILNVASVASFQGVPGMSLYAASKAFVLSLTEGLSEDLRGTGVTVTALCPGLTRTEMADTLLPADLPQVLLADPHAVAVEGFRACMAAEVVRVPGLVNQAMVGWAKHQPRWLVRTLSGIVSRQSLNRDRA